MYEELKTRLEMIVRNVSADTLIMSRNIRDEIEYLIEQELVDNHQVLVNVIGGKVIVNIFNRLDEVKASFELDTKYSNIAKSTSHKDGTGMSNLGPLNIDYPVLPKQIEVKALPITDNVVFADVSALEPCTDTPASIDSTGALTPIQERRLSIITLLQKGMRRKEIISKLNLTEHTWVKDMAALKCRGVVTNTGSNAQPVYRIHPNYMHTVCEPDSKYGCPVDSDINDKIITAVRNNQRTKQAIADYTSFTPEYIRKCLKPLMEQGILHTHIGNHGQLSYYLPEEDKPC